MCCSVLQCAAGCCSVLQCVAVCCSVIQCVAVCCSVLQCVAVCCSVLQCIAVCCSVLQCIAMTEVHDLSWLKFVQCVTMCCRALQRIIFRGNSSTRDKKKYFVHSESLRWLVTLSPRVSCPRRTARGACAHMRAMKVNSMCWRPALAAVRNVRVDAAHRDSSESLPMCY